MLRVLAVSAVVIVLAVGVSPAQADPQPIRGFTVAVKGDQIRASALVPGPVGRTARLQQLAAGRWVTVARTQTKRARSTPRARWRVDVDALRPAGSRVQAGPLAELIRLRAQSGKAKSKPKGVRVTLAIPAVPELVIGAISGRQSKGDVELTWDGRVTYRYARLVEDRSTFALYSLDAAFLNWRLSGNSGGCTVSGTGTFTMPELRGDGAVFAPTAAGGSFEYQFLLEHDTPLTITYVCSNGDTGTFPFDNTLSVNTLRCPSVGTPGILPQYTAQPARAGQDLWKFTGEVANDISGLCSDTYNPPGFLYTWDLTGTDPQLLVPE